MYLDALEEKLYHQDVPETIFVGQNEHNIEEKVSAARVMFFF